MDLWCPELASSPGLLQQDSVAMAMDEQPRRESLPAAVDRNVLDHAAGLQQLLVSEASTVPPCVDTVFKYVQKELKPHMRKILTTWMLEVSDELACDSCTLPLAVNLVDRFLAQTPATKDQLQLLGAVALLVASKLRQCSSIHPEALVFYSDYSISVSDITLCEMMLLSSLKWDVSAVVATDFVDPLLARLHLIATTDEGDHSGSGGHDATNALEDSLRRHTASLIGLCTTEAKFSHKMPSLVATACLAAAAQGLLGSDSSFALITTRLQEITGIMSDELNQCIDEVLSVLAARQLAPVQLAAVKSMPASNPLAVNHALTNGADPMLSKGVATKSNTVIINATPTDVNDVYFE